ncbi:hypothetical protein L0F51_17950 [Afifella sp. H1R]|uniref:hypothetical protein n=1 Tax=Afifella sp. H1R TaxID=2908841 RepID=UPI001F395B90|nr:hypothetical protein [Afifella sp. H1R]MCF1505640.1 hypothetical protein [Afifella sp. H1R]
MTEETGDSIIRLANDFGLFGIVSVLLGLVGILLALSGIVAYIDVKRTARKTAEEVATRIARDVAEREAVAYLQAEMPAIMDAYLELARDAVDDPDAIAAAQEDENGER